ncbi:MAG: hypothetical protein WCY30_05810 [Candidatus Neomarinimicrobiota bacterium]|jgi:hypothetical protein
MASDISTIISDDKLKNPIEKIIDVFQGRLPANIKEVFKFVRAVIVGNDIIAPAVAKLAETPVTNIMVVDKNNDESNSDAAEKLQNIFIKTLKIHTFIKGISFDLYGYYNAFASIYFAPTRYLVCEDCKRKRKKDKSIQYRWHASKIEWRGRVITGINKLSDIEFSGRCPSCHKNVIFKKQDVIYHNVKNIRLIRWDPFYIELDHYKALGRNEYYYKFPSNETRRINGMDRIILTEYPWEYIVAALNNRLLRINQKGFHHFKLEGISGVYEGWGVPKIMSTLSVLYTLTMLMKANESTSEGRVNDLTIISPTPNRTGVENEDPIGALGLESWLEKTKNVLEKFRRDRTITALLPFPVTAEHVFGQGRMQLITEELRIYIRSILGALGVSEDVIYSAGTYTSIAVASRTLANQADIAKKAFDEYLSFVKDIISRSINDLDFSNVSAMFEPYESADDFQKLNTQIQTALAGRFPWSLIYKRWGYDIKDIKKMLSSEVKMFGEIEVAKAKSEGRGVAESAAVNDYFRMMLASEMAKWNAMSQSIEGNNNNNMDASKIQQAATQLANSIVSDYPPQMWEMLIMDITRKDSNLGKIVGEMVRELSGGQETGQPEPELQNNQQEAVAAIGGISRASEMPDKRVPRSPTKL